MKRLILFELIILLLATTFESDSPPGWFQQALPVNDIVNDIFFIDTSNGWLVTQGNFASNDTSYIMNTTNGGSNWIVQSKNRENLNVVQFLDVNTGYAAGGTNGTVFITFYKSTNSGINWTTLNNLGGIQINDMFFLNKDTGWICDKDNFVGAGLQKTTDGGASWFQQLNKSFGPSKLFFINKDTGWVACNSTQFYKTTNGGANWNLQFNFIPFDNVTRDIFFINSNTGWSTHYSPADTNEVYITTNGGFNWLTQRSPDPTSSGMGEVFFLNTTTGFIAGGSIIKTTNSGVNWFKQTSPSINYGSLSFVNVNTGWVAGLILVHTTDGGGPPVGIQQIGTEIPFEYKLYQNYPNPFNPATNIKYSVKSRQGGTSSETSNVKLTVYNLQGRQIELLVNQKQTAGTYVVDFTGNNLPSGIYFYSLSIDGKTIDTKKMVLIK